MSNKWKIFWVLSFALVVFFQACSSWEEILVSKQDEKDMGKEFDALVRAGDPQVLSPGEKIFVPSNAAQNEFFDYYQAKAKEIVSNISQKDWDGLLTGSYTKDNFFEFKIIESEQVNAFAVPGGYVYFYTSILNQFQTESELMGVLGHEVGHVVLHHSRDGMVKQAGAAVIIDVFLGGGIGGLIGTLGANFWLLGNGQGNELQSDSMGYYFTNKIGISSEGLGDFFGRALKSYDPVNRTCDESDESSIFDALSTHPPSCKRVMENKRRMGNQNFDKDRPNNPANGGKTYSQLRTAANF
jgi:predicted Zn-dependent protease